MNLQATTIDRGWRTPILASIHAMFYVGGLTGATVSAQLFTLGWEASNVAVALAGFVALTIVGASLSGLPIALEPSSTRWVLFPQRAVFRIGVLVFLGFLVEGAMMDGEPSTSPRWMAFRRARRRGASLSLPAA